MVRAFAGELVAPAAGGWFDAEGLQVPVDGLGGDTEDQGGAADGEASFPDKLGDLLSGVGAATVSNHGVKPYRQSPHQSSNRARCIDIVG